MDGQCVKHQFEPAVDACRDCGLVFCNECLVYSFGENKPPYCVACALAVAGVSHHNPRPPRVSKRELRRLEKARKKAALQDARLPAEPHVPAIDWNAPFGDGITASGPGYEPIQSS